MNCPSCNSPLLIVELNKVEIDLCYECKGVWLDAGELELLIEKDERKNNSLLSPVKKNGVTEKKIKCPLCSKKMDKFFVGDSGVILDKCKKDHGLWFDKGELKKILSDSKLNTENKIVEHLSAIFKSKKIVN